MDLNCELISRNYVNDKGEVFKYYVLKFLLSDNDEDFVEVPIKKEKAQLLILSNKLINN